MLKAKIDSLDTIDEKDRHHYKEVDGKFIADIESVDGYALEDIQGLKSALGKERKSAETFSKKLSLFGDNTPDTVSELIAQVEQLKDGSSEEKLNSLVEAKVKSVRDKLEGDITSKDTQITDLNGLLEKIVIESAIDTALSQFDFQFEGAKNLIRPHIKEQLKLGKDPAGVPIAKVIDIKNPDAGERISLKTGSTDFMDVTELLSLMSSGKDFSGIFKGSGKSGGGDLTKPNGNNTQKQPFQYSNQNQDTPQQQVINPMERLKAARENPEPTNKI